MNLEREIEFFDAFADHSDYDVFSERGYDRLLAAFGSMVAPRPGERCVDLGCGTGAFTRRLRRFSLDLTGIDISSRSIERAKSLADGERYAVGDVRDTGLPAASFDIVTFSGVLHHLTTSEERGLALHEAARLLRPGGRLFSFDPSAHSPATILYRDPRSPLYSSQGKTSNEVLIDRDDIRRVSAVPVSAMSMFGASGVSSWFS